MLPFIHVGDMKLGPIPLHPFGLLVATGVILGTNITLWRARKRGIDLELLNSFITWMLVAGFIGGHMLDQIFYHPQEVIRQPLTLVGLWLGLSSFGGFTGGLIGILLWKYLRSSLPKPTEDPGFGTSSQGFWLILSSLVALVWRQVSGELPMVGASPRGYAICAGLAVIGVALIAKAPPKTARGRRPLIGGALGLVGGALLGTVAGFFLWKGLGAEYPLREDPIRAYCFEMPAERFSERCSFSKQ